MNHELARKKLCLFTRKIRDVVVDGEPQLILAGGNSGIVAASITRLVLEELGISTPPIILVPFYRYHPEHMHDENYRIPTNVFLPDLGQKLSEIENHASIKRALFVDDEMGGGSTLAGILELIKAVLGEKDQLTECIAVVERHPGHLPPPNQIGSTNVIIEEYDGFSGVIGALMYLVKDPDPMHEGGIKESFCRKLGAPVKRFNDGNPVLENTNKPSKEFIEDLKKQINGCLTEEI